MKKILALFLAGFIGLGAGNSIGANTPISGLPDGGLMRQTDSIPVVRGGVTMKATPYTWPTTGKVMISNATSAPDGIAPINGDCLAGSGGVWAAIPCSSGSVTSVGVTGGNGIGVSGSPVTSSGFISLSLGDITPNSVVATGTVTGSNLSGTNTGDQTISLTGDVTGSGTGSFAATIGANRVTLSKMATGTNNSLLGYNNSGAAANVAIGSGLSLSGGTLSASGGSGSVTSVGLTGDGTVFNSVVSGSPVTTSGTFTLALLNQNQNLFLAGPASGSAAAPAFRAIASADLPVGSFGALGALSPDNVTITSAAGVLSNAFVFQCSGFDQTSQIQSAINTIGGGSGIGRIIFKGGSSRLCRTNNLSFASGLNIEISSTPGTIFEPVAITSWTSPWWTFTNSTISFGHFEINALNLVQYALEIDGSFINSPNADVNIYNVGSLTTVSTGLIVGMHLRNSTYADIGSLSFSGLSGYGNGTCSSNAPIAGVRAVLVDATGSSGLGNITSGSNIITGNTPISNIAAGSTTFYQVSDATVNIPPGTYVVSASAFTLATTADTNSSTSLTNVANTTGLFPGQAISGTGIPSNTSIVSISGSTITMSQAATATATGIATTFNGSTVTMSANATATANLESITTVLPAAWTHIHNLFVKGGAVQGDNGEQLDMFQAQLNTLGGVIDNAEMAYNGNWRRAMKFQSGRWSVKLKLVKGSDFVPVSGLNLGATTLNAFDWAASGTGGGVTLLPGSSVDCTGFPTCLAQSAGALNGYSSTIVADGVHITGIAPQGGQTRPATVCGALAANYDTIGFYNLGGDVGSGIMNSVITGFGQPLVQQGSNEYAINNIFNDPVDYVAVNGTGTARDGYIFSGNTILTKTPGNLNAAAYMFRFQNTTNIKVSNTTFLEEGNTGHGGTLFYFSNAGASGRVNNTYAPQVTTPVNVLASSVVNCDNSGVQSVLCGGTGITSGTSGGIPYFSSSSGMASSAALAANAAVVGGGAGVAPASTPMKINPSTGAVDGYGASQNTQSGTTYTLVASDTGKTLIFTSNSAVTVTLPNNLAANFVCEVVQQGSGQVTFTPASGASLQNRQSQSKTAGQFANVKLEATSNAGGTSAVYNLAGDTGS